LKPLDTAHWDSLIGAAMHDTHQEFFDRLANEWDLAFTSEDLERLSSVINRLQIESGYDILDLGCGTGILFDLLRRRVGPKGSVIGVDFSLQMADRAHRNFPFDNVTVVHADASVLPFQNACFDMAVAFSAFPHFSDQTKALHETHRVLKPGASVHIIHLLSSKELAAVHHRVGGVVAHDELPDADSLRGMFKETGFVGARIEDKPGLYIASAINVA
jgi:ubiquinone/menaquinone biosynthesis C-methylase UbiE